MVFSNDFLHFLKIKNFFFWIHQNYLVALSKCVQQVKKYMWAESNLFPNPVEYQELYVT